MGLNKNLLICICLCLAPVLSTNQNLWSKDSLLLPETNEIGKSQVEELQNAIGEYRDEIDSDFTLSISREGDQLYLEGPRVPRAALETDHPDGFHISNSPIKVFLRRGLKNEIVGIDEKINQYTRHLTKFSSKPRHFEFPNYERTEVMIPMRDGNKLHAVILRPEKSKDPHSKPLPFLLERTPYGAYTATSNGINRLYTELARSGYIFVFEDIRGRYGSDGKFQMLVPITLGTMQALQTCDHISDTYDTISWLISNTENNNGRVGIMGISYPGTMTHEATLQPHPALKAVAPQAPLIDAWMGDDFFHNGAFRQTYGFDYAIRMETNKQDTTTVYSSDAYEYFLKGGSFKSTTLQTESPNLPTWNDFIAHPNYDEFWKTRGLENFLKPNSIPTFEVGGYWDQEDMWGPQEAYQRLKQNQQTDNNVFLVLGPWNHSQWKETTQHLGAIDFQSSTTDVLRQHMAGFFARFLKDETGWNPKNAITFQTGSNKWTEYDVWPPTKNVEHKKLYFQPNAQLSFESSKNEVAPEEKSISYTSDPLNPIPYRQRPIQVTYADDSKWETWLVEDQRFVTSRPDTVSWKTNSLTEDVTITGEVTADIFASTSGRDADYVVKLIDVYPDEGNSQTTMNGYQLMVASEIFRSRYRNSFEKPEPLTPNEINELKWSLHGINHVFLKGHRMMVQIQSTWFPLYDRNPQSFVSNIMTAAPEDYKKQTETIYVSDKHPSHLEVPVVKCK